MDRQRLQDSHFVCRQRVLTVLKRPTPHNYDHINVATNTLPRTRAGFTTTALRTARVRDENTKQESATSAATRNMSSVCHMHAHTRIRAGAGC